MAGKIYLVATPIGNLGDISARALTVLREVDLIAAEDTRNTVRLLNHFEIKKPLTSYHEYNKTGKAYVLAREAQEGKNIAVVTDAGMPAISDPGEVLVRTAYEMGVEVTIIPGACACVSALAVSGLPTRRFCFEAFLPQERKARMQILEELKTETRTIILYEAPHRLRRTLQELGEALGETRRLSLVRELTKLHEEVQRQTIGEALAMFETAEGSALIRGEYVLVLEGRDPEELTEKAQAEWRELSVSAHVHCYEEQGMSRKEAMRAAAADRGMSRRDIYQALL
ncbi:MAG: 16S rRNA (cytidine(1402)-2'-O)-methyltransferase [Stomatobaculum sp.]